MRLPFLRHLGMLLLLGLLLCSQVRAQSKHAEVEVGMNRAKGYPSFAVSASMTVAAELARSWSVLTDYERLPQFVPNLESSRVIAHNGNESVVAQHGYATFLFIRQAVDLRLSVTEQAMESIDLRLLGGNMREYQARWELHSIDNGQTRITYTGQLAPDFYVPSLFGAALMKRDLRNMLDAVKAEMEK